MNTSLRSGFLGLGDLAAQECREKEYRGPHGLQFWLLVSANKALFA